MADPSRTGAQEQLVSPQDPGVIRSPDADSQAQHTSAPAFATSQATASTETGHLEHLGHVGRKNTTRKPVGGATAAVESSTISDGNATAQPASVNKNFSSTDSGPEFGADKVVESAVLAPQGEVSASQLEHQSFEDDRQLHEGDKIDRQRLSTSPQLPDVARMSAFGADLFTANQKRASALGEAPREEPEAEQAASTAQAHAPASLPVSTADNTLALRANKPEPAQSEMTSEENLAVTGADIPLEANDKTETAAPSHMWRPSVPGEQTADQEAAASTDVAEPQQQEISPVSEHDTDTEAALNKDPAVERNVQLATLQPSHDEPTVAPLRTPSPRASQVSAVAAAGLSEESNELAPLNTKESNTVPTTSQEARAPEYSPSDYDPKSLQREATFSTVTSSPLKESDILRDEIIKSLSPRAEAAPADFPPAAAQKPVSEPGKGPSRESTYTLSGYDSYWAEGQERNAQPTIPEESEQAPAVPAPEEKPSIAAPTATVTNPPARQFGPNTASPSGSDADADARRRFSWEMEGGAAPPVPVVREETNDHSQALDGQVEQTETVTTQAPLPGTVTPTEQPLVREPPQEPATTNTDVSHQVSQASTTRTPGQAQLSTPDPPSPVSNPSDRNPVQETRDRRPSLAEQKSGVRSEATPVAPSPPPGIHPALASPTGSQNAASEQPLMTFREIMSLSGPQERISKYDEARTRFATIDSGLSEWIANLKASHPDHTNATAQFNGSLGPTGGDPARVPSPLGGQAPSQQPYYQQYLNASSPTSSGPGKRLGGLSVSGQSASSAFGHSSDKIGTKGKEFMQSAGKMGKGLFSKGKSKLRGTGDKVFH